MKRYSKVGLLATTALTMSVLSFGTALAAIDEIIVTVQKKEQSLQDVSASVSVLTDDFLESANIGRIEDLYASLPNVVLDTNAGLRSSVVTIRGISSDPNNPGVPQSVGVFVDGVYMSRPTTINSSLYDVERIEVIRGPQGTLYGKNTIAGAINFISKKPDDTFGGDVSFSYGNYDAIKSHAVVNLPVSDSFGIRASVSHQSRDGFLDNSFTGQEMNDLNETSGRITAAWEPSDSLELVFRGDIARTTGDAGQQDMLLGGTALPFIVPGLTVDTNPNDRAIALDVTPSNTKNVAGASLEVNYDAGFGTLKSITAYRTFDWVNRNDFDDSPASISIGGISEDLESWSQELTFSGSAGDSFDYLVGAYYSDEELETTSSLQAGDDFLDAVFFPAFLRPDTGAHFADVSTESWALYGQGTFQVTDRLEIEGGVRYSSDEKSVDYSADDLLSFPFFIATPETQFNREDDEFTGSVSANFDVNDDISVYASWARGFKSGGFNVFSLDRQVADPTKSAEFEPETVDNYEIGFKSTLFGGNARLNASVFYLEYEDLQVSEIVDLLSTVSNAGSAESKGLEIEFVADLSDEVSLSANYGYLDAEYKEFVKSPTVDYSGNTLTEAPEHTFNLGVQYEVPVNDTMNFVGRVDGSYRSEVFFSPSNNPILSEDGITLLNARAGFQSAEGDWGVYLWGRNLTDEFYSLATFDASLDFFWADRYAFKASAPRTYGIEVKAAF